ncbi:sperm flagellar protein 1-like [Lycorma delicatula]|uniref:sperm flagellar protein 1-like n=1 Tax=Lycorma delicatula TaxID=130591 RepID=UPI003F517B25
MHNYSPANSFTLKMNNWMTLNKKVLKKLDLTLSDEKLTAISSSEPGAIEEFLRDIKKTVENRAERKISGNNEHFSFLINSSEMIDKGNCDWELWQKQIKKFSDDLLKLRNRLSEKDEVIDILQQKVTHLEAMIELKDQRIADLTKQLARYNQSRPDTEQSTSSGSTLHTSIS